MTLEATLEATVDDGVAFVFHVVNAGSDVVELSFRSGQRAEVTVRDADAGHVVWRWSDDRMFTQALESETLAAGQGLELVYTWEDAPAGSYTAVATLEADVDAEARTSFTV